MDISWQNLVALSLISPLRRLWQHKTTVPPHSSWTFWNDLFKNFVGDFQQFCVPLKHREPWQYRARKYAFRMFFLKIKLTAYFGEHGNPRKAALRLLSGQRHSHRYYISTTSNILSRRVRRRCIIHASGCVEHQTWLYVSDGWCSWHPLWPHVVRHEDRQDQARPPSNASVSGQFSCLGATPTWSQSHKQWWLYSNLECGEITGTFLYQYFFLQAEWLTKGS